MVFRLTGDDTQIYLTKDTRGRRPMRRTGGHGRLDAAQGEVPTLHGAFHAQRALQGPADPQGMGVRRPEGGIRHGKPGIRAGQSRTSRRGDEV